jgi:hypothetical protein
VGGRSEKSIKKCRKQGKEKAIGVGTIIRFLAGSEWRDGGGGRSEKVEKKKCFHTKFSPEGDMGKSCRSIRKMSSTIKVK